MGECIVGKIEAIMEKLCVECLTNPATQTTVTGRRVCDECYRKLIGLAAAMMGVSSAAPAGQTAAMAVAGENYAGVSQPSSSSGREEPTAPSPEAIKAAFSVLALTGALLALEQLLMGNAFDGFFKLIGFYSDDPVGAGLTAFLFICVGAGMLSLAYGVWWKSSRRPWMPVLVWAIVCPAYGAISSIISADGSPSQALFGTVLMAVLAAFGAVPGTAIGMAVRQELTKAAATSNKKATKR